MKLGLNENTKYNIFATSLKLYPSFESSGNEARRLWKLQNGRVLYFYFCVVCPGLVTQFKDQRALLFGEPLGLQGDLALD